MSSVQTKGCQRAFTVIEMLVVLAILALLLSITAPTLMSRVQTAQETALKHNLATIRAAIDQFKADQGRYPSSLQELVPLGYLHHVPEDPVTQSATTWKLVAASESTPISTVLGAPGHSNPTTPTPEPTTGFSDIRSGASGRSRTGEPYANW
jgi:general secretion pathway protein G